MFERENTTSTPFCTSSERETAEQFLQRIEPFIIPRIDNVLMQSIIEQLHLDKLVTRHDHLKNFIQAIMNTAEDISLFLHKMRTALLSNEVICQLLAYVQDHDLISDEELCAYQPTLRLQIHLLYLFEAITVTMANSDAFVDVVYQHITQRRDIYHPGNSYYTAIFGVPVKTTLFERLKLISIEPSLLNIVLHRETRDSEENTADVAEFIQRYQLSGLNAEYIYPAKYHVKETDIIAGMGLNIIEAAWEDSVGVSKESGGKENSAAAFGLIAWMEFKRYQNKFKRTVHVMPENGTVSEDGYYSLISKLKIDENAKKVSQFDIDREWRDLYNSWNMRFCAANMDSVFLPLKLLLPSVFSAQPKNFKELRVLSLYLFGNIYLNEQTTKNKLFKPAVQFKHSAAILSVWGRMNESYAAYSMHRLCPGITKTPKELYATAFGDSPTWKFLKNMYLFSKESTRYRQFYSGSVARDADDHEDKIRAEIIDTGSKITDDGDQSATSLVSSFSTFFSSKSLRQPALVGETRLRERLPHSQTNLNR